VTVLRLRTASTLVCAAVFALTASACSENLTSPTTAAEFSQTDLRVGTGAEAVAGNEITVHYTGWFYDSTRPDKKGVQFETSAGQEPFTFILGAGQVIRGWDQGLVGIRVGGLRQLVLPPEYAYGAGRTGKIPPDATLLFDVELISITPPATQ
jgi:FKBP-type peptidyl-prolyl cis-trans isomerase FkpA